ncbi:hypothetical protein A2U01_0040612 [Trifolium medium]|uniref:Uncharacterized protein n=1 Tax=Trifolium medium TaxID=97028 RepID=A0A392Q7E0_9FABA|nr:hypothetical protein [Trifolium medium]
MLVVFAYSGCVILGCNCFAPFSWSSVFGRVVDRTAFGITVTGWCQLRT